MVVAEVARRLVLREDPVLVRLVDLSPTAGWSACRRAPGSSSCPSGRCPAPAGAPARPRPSSGGRCCRSAARRSRRRGRRPGSRPRCRGRRPTPPRSPTNAAWIAGSWLQLVRSWYARAPTTPKMTPQSATRKTRSQSPPQLTQRRPVSQMQAAMPRRSMTPYMCSVSGPRLKVPLEGDGMEARTTPVTAAHCARAPGRALLDLAQDPDRELDRAAALDERRSRRGDRRRSGRRARRRRRPGSPRASARWCASARRARASVSMMSCAAGIRSLRSHMFGICARIGSPPPGGFATIGRC